MDELATRDRWPAGDGEMARRIREHDWAASPLGPIEAWPQSLRTIVDLMMANPVANILVHGPERVLIYNDACILLYGKKHPSALGSKGPDAFPELWDEIGPLYDRVFAGEQLSFKAQPWAFERGVAPRAGLYDAYFTPVRDETGQVAFAFVTAIEVTNRESAETALRESEERQSFLLKLSDVLRAEPNADAVAARAIRMLSEHMALDRCYIASYRPADDRADITHQVGNDGVPALPDMIRLSDFPAAFRQVFDQTLIIDDVVETAGLSETDRRNIEALGLRALIAPTLRKGENNPLWVIVAVSARPRHWTRGEIALIEEVAERTWAAIERARADMALQKSEKEHRLLFDSIDQGFCVINMLFDDAGKPVDYRFLQTNPAFQRQTGLTDAIGRTMREMAPDHEEHWYEIYGRIALTGEPKRFENEAAALGHSYEVYAFRIGEPEERRVAILFNDIRARKQAEQVLRESEERFRQFGDASSDVLWIRNAENLQWEYLSPAFELIYGIDREDALRADNLDRWTDLILDEDRVHVLERIGRVKAGERVTFEFRIRRPSDGEVRWLRDTDFPLMGNNGRVERIGGIGQDVTNEKETSDRLQVLVGELQHRTRNLMTVVRSVVERTRREAGSFDNFGDVLRARLEALSRAQSLLSRRTSGHKVTFDELLNAELAAHIPLDEAHSRVTLEGPAGIRLPSTSVQTLTLAIHELTTNAVKYGALSQPEGRLAVRWRVERNGTGDVPRLSIDWREQGVVIAPAGAKSPGAGGGYGRELIERALPYQLKATTTYEIGPEGVHCTISLPVAANGP